MQWTKIPPTKARATYLWSAGTTYQGAHGVDVAVIASSYADRYFVPVAAFGKIGCGELPSLSRVVQALEQALLLLFFREMQEDLHDSSPAPVEMVLEPVDVLEPLFPPLPRRSACRRHPGFFATGRPGVHPDHQYLFVVGTVEDPDAAPFGQCLRRTPEEVVLELVRRGALEGDDLTTLRIDPGHDVLDRPVLSRSVHALDDEQQGVRIAGPQPLLGVFSSSTKELSSSLAISLVTVRNRSMTLRRFGRTTIQTGRVAWADRELLDNRLVELHPGPSRRLPRPRPGPDAARA